MLTSQVGYLGNEACQTCHLEEFKKWSESHHAKAMMVANDSSVLGDFSDVEFEKGGIPSRFYRDGSKFMVRTEGPDGEPADFEIKYTFGWTPLQQYLVEFVDGRLQALHTAWDTKEKKWLFRGHADRFRDESVATET